MKPSISSVPVKLTACATSSSDNILFAQIAAELHEHGLCVIENALPENIAKQMYSHIKVQQLSQFARAGIGRNSSLSLDSSVRSDLTRWIDHQSETGKLWLPWATQLMHALNQHLFLGLFAFESHYAVYRPGDCYRKHLDAFKGDTNRILSLVTYLNKDWQPDDGGALVIYRPGQVPAVNILPEWGKLVLFLSEEFPHEVLPATRERYSVSGWYSVNSKLAGITKSIY